MLAVAAALSGRLQNMLFQRLSFKTFSSPDDIIYDETCEGKVPMFKFTSSTKMH